MSTADVWTIDGFRPDNYQWLEDFSGLSDKEAVLLPLALWLEAGEHSYLQTNCKIGVLVAASEEINLLFGALNKLSLIALDFPVFNDGRSYSKAALLRAQGFSGELRAIGDVLIDQAAFMLRVGFDTLQVRHRTTIRRLQQGALNDAPHYYQPGTGSVRIKGEFSWRRFKE